MIDIHYVLLGSKAELNQCLAGLSALGVSDVVKANFDLFGPYFCIGKSSPLVAGMAYYYYSLPQL